MSLIAVNERGTELWSRSPAYGLVGYRAAAKNLETLPNILIR